MAYQSAKADTRTEVRFGNYAPKLGRSPSDAETPKPVIHRSLITVHRANAGPESRRLLSPQWAALVWITDPRSSLTSKLLSQASHVAKVYRLI